VEHVTQHVISNTNTLKSAYFVYIHSTMKHGISFWGNSSDGKMIFTLEKKIVRLMAGVNPRNSCKNRFKKLKILTLPCENIISLMDFIVNNQEHFQTNCTIHSVNTKNKNLFHRPIAKISCFLKNAYYADIKIFNTPPSSYIDIYLFILSHVWIVCSMNCCWEIS
jgi:hypothetical protein